MKLSDIIESSEPYQRVIWAVIQQEFDALMKPIGHIENKKLYNQWLEIKIDSLDWITQPRMTIEEEERVRRRIKAHEARVGKKLHAGISFNYACEIVKVKPDTLIKIYFWAISQDPPFTYYPVSVEFKNLRKQLFNKEDENLEAEESIPNPTLELLDSDLVEDQDLGVDEVLYKTDWYDDVLFGDDNFIIKAAMQTMSATAAGDE